MRICFICQPKGPICAPKPLLAVLLNAQPRYLCFSSKWASVASLEHTSWGRKQVTCWLGERPARRGGKWAVGCHFCAHLIHKLAGDPQQRKLLPGAQVGIELLLASLSLRRPIGSFLQIFGCTPCILRLGSRLATKWGAYEVRSLRLGWSVAAIRWYRGVAWGMQSPQSTVHRAGFARILLVMIALRKVMQACYLQQHARCTVHRVAAEFYLAPEKPLVQCLPYLAADQGLFKGNVPQPLDWLRAWRACRTPSSFQGALQYFETEDFAAGHRCGLRKGSRLHWARVFAKLFPKRTFCFPWGN